MRNGAATEYDLFQSTLPVRGATVCGGSRRDSGGNFNPRSPCGERQIRTAIQRRVTYNFNPRSPCGERPTLTMVGCGDNEDFNPRSPCGERLRLRETFPPLQNFNPRSPCGERHRPNGHRDAQIYFNPRSPCGERLLAVFMWAIQPRFQSTLPVRGATVKIRIFIRIFK